IVLPPHAQVQPARGARSVAPLRSQGGFAMSSRPVLARPAAALAGVALLTALVLPVASFAKDKPAPAKGDAAAPPAADKPYGDWKKLTKDAEVMKGFITLYHKRENLYAELRP